MATIKSYTDLVQSKKLAEILPIESADYTHLGKGEDNVLTRPYFESCSSELKEWIGKDEMSPCWSLAALLVILPTMIGGEFDEVLQLKMDKHLRGFHFWYISLDTDKVKEGLDIVELNPVDACVKMIERLHELNLL